MFKLVIIKCFGLFLLTTYNIYAVEDKNTKLNFEILNDIYSDNSFTFFCGCEFRENGVNYQKCSYYPKINNKNAHKIKWVKIIRMNDIIKNNTKLKKINKKCINKNWGKRKKNKCVKKNKIKLLNKLKKDLHLVYPVISQISKLTFNKDFKIINKEKRKFGECDLEVNKRFVEPRDEIKGDIARLYKYVSVKYEKDNLITKKKDKLFNTWSKNDPADDWECKRSEMIEKETGIVNPILKKLCKG